MTVHFEYSIHVQKMGIHDEYMIHKLIAIFTLCNFLFIEYVEYFLLLWYQLTMTQTMTDLLNVNKKKKNLYQHQKINLFTLMPSAQKNSRQHLPKPFHFTKVQAKSRPVTLEGMALVLAPMYTVIKGEIHIAHDTKIWGILLVHFLCICKNSVRRRRHIVYRGQWQWWNWGRWELWGNWHVGSFDWWCIPVSAVMFVCWLYWLLCRCSDCGGSLTFQW